MIDYKKLFATILMLAFFIPFNTMAADTAKVYSEQDFLKAFSGKTRKVVLEQLGAPVKKEQSVRPVNAAGVIGQRVDVDNSKPVNVEMWYYKSIVEYAPKKRYKTTEITFVNDRCMNIAFFNNQ